MPKKTKRFWVEISEKANDALQKDATREHRSRKAQIEYLIEEKYNPSVNTSQKEQPIAA